MKNVLEAGLTTVLGGFLLTSIFYTLNAFNSIVAIS